MTRPRRGARSRTPRSRRHTIWNPIGAVSIVALCGILAIDPSPGHAQEEKTKMNRSPNRSIVADGLGRLPQFSHATVAGDLIFVSGTLGTVGESFELAEGGTGAQTTQTLKNIETILRAAGAEMSDVVKVSVYLAEMGTFSEMNKAYAAFFADSPPARITVGGADLALGAAVEIECIARQVR